MFFLSIKMQIVDPQMFFTARQSKATKFIHHNHNEGLFKVQITRT